MEEERMDPDYDDFVGPSPAKISKLDETRGAYFIESVYVKLYFFHVPNEIL